MTPCPGCEQPFAVGDQMMLAQAGQLTATVHVGCQKRWRARVYGRPFACPACSGTGAVDDHSRPIKSQVRDHDADEADGYNGVMYARENYKTVITGYERQDCPQCGGWGATERELKPVIKTTVEVIGWK